MPVWDVQATGSEGDMITCLVKGWSPKGHSEVEGPHGARGIMVTENPRIATRAEENRLCTK